MIFTNLITAIAITTGLGVNLTNFNIESRKPKATKNNANENIVNYNLTINKSNSTWQESTNGNYHYYFNRNNLSAQNAALNIVGSQYYQGNLHGQENEMVTGNYEEATWGATIIKITSYNSNINTEQTQIIRTDIYDPNLQEGSQIKIIQETYITTINNWDTYIGQNNYGTVGYIYNLREEISGPTQGYTYSYNIQEQNINIQTTTRDHYITFENELELGTNLNQYIVMFYHYENVGFITPLVHNYGLNFSTMSISGTMIIPGNTEVIDIPGVMFYVLTMPFTFISVAFNLTLFPGTPYQVNIANLFLALFAVLVFIFIMKIIVKINSGS